MTDRDLEILGWTSMIFGWIFALVNYPWPALPLMLIAFVCFFILATRKLGGGDGPEKPA